MSIKGLVDGTVAIYFYIGLIEGMRNGDLNQERGQPRTPRTLQSAVLHSDGGPLSLGEERGLLQNQDYRTVLDFLSTYGSAEDEKVLREFATNPMQHSQGDGIDQRELHKILASLARVCRMTAADFKQDTETGKFFSDPSKRVELITSLLGDLDDRKGQQSQGVLETCGVASALTGLLASGQADYVGSVVRLLDDGYDEATGIEVPRGMAQVIGKRGMSISSHLSQMALMHAATGSYNPITDTSRRQWLASISPKQLDQPGLASDEVRLALQKYYSAGGKERGVKMFEDPAKQGVELLRSIAAASQDHRPILFSARGLHIVGQNSGFHCINITGLTQEKDPQTGEVKTFLVFKDTRGPKFPLDLQRTQGISVEDAHRNTYRVEAGIFLRDYANFAMIVNRPTQGIDPDVIKGIDPQRLWEVVNQNKYTVGEIILTQMTELDKEAVIKVTPIEKKSGSEERDSREEKYRARREDELRDLARRRMIKSRVNLDKEDKIRV